jgi:glutamate dehydrogenase
VLQRVPESYLRAVFASTIGSKFVYEHGLHANEIDFLHFVRAIAK